MVREILEISLRNLDADVLAEINKQATAMQNGTDAERQKAMMSLFLSYPNYLAKVLNLRFPNLVLKYLRAWLKVTYYVSLPKGDNANPFELIQKVQGNAKLKVPKAVVKQLMQQSVMQQMAKQPDMQQALIQQLQSIHTTSQ